jgi:hypothetical protein
MKATKLNRLTPMIAAACVAFAGAAFAQQPAPMPAKPEKAMTPPPAANAAAPTSSQSVDALFKRIDTDTDGSLTKAELEKFDPEAAKSFDKYDADKDSKLSLTEFDTMVKGMRAG